MKKPNISLLFQILQIRRPSRSKDEAKFVETWLRPRLPADHMQDKYGNLWVVVGEKPTTMFSSHTDTVHTQGGFQKITYDQTKMQLFTADRNSSCLGADDGTGIWLMLHMISNGIPGLYIFHRDEEIGGGGSAFITKELDDNQRLEGIKHCVAFDRKGYTDIITHQGGTRTASDEFATALAAQLRPGIDGYKACDGGSFTDSKNYRHLIPECTNLAVGYFSQHTKHEYQDLAFAVKLAASLCHVKWHELPAARNPKAIEPQYTPPSFAYTRTHGHYDLFGASTPPAKPAKRNRDLPRFRELEYWARQHPTSAAFLLYTYGVTKDDLFDAEDTVKNDANYRPVVIQRTDDVRTLPPGGKKAIH